MFAIERICVLKSQGSSVGVPWACLAIKPIFSVIVVRPRTYIFVSTDLCLIYQRELPGFMYHTKLVVLRQVRGLYRWKLEWTPASTLFARQSSMTNAQGRMMELGRCGARANRVDIWFEDLWENYEINILWQNLSEKLVGIWWLDKLNNQLQICLWM